MVVGAADRHRKADSHASLAGGAGVAWARPGRALDAPYGAARHTGLLRLAVTAAGATVVCCSPYAATKRGNTSCAHTQSSARSGSGSVSCRPHHRRHRGVENLGYQQREGLASISAGPRSANAPVRRSITMSRISRAVAAGRQERRSAARARHSDVGGECAGHWRAIARPVAVAGAI